MSKVAFYAPIKPPDHPIPSGDRLIARNLIKALEFDGHSVTLASRFIAYSKREAEEILRARKSSALEEAERIIANYSKSPPDIWITYHPYCKAPDWIGPRVSQALGIPYVTVEAAHTGQGFENGGDRWALWRQEAQAGIKSADLHLALKPDDRDYLARVISRADRIKMIPPFLDTTISDPLPTVTHPPHWRPKTPVLITTGMMRPGKKLKNYELLAEALLPLQSLHWNLIVIGDGPERPNVEALLVPINSERIWFTGAIPHSEVLAHMAKADIFAWPGWKEPIGMVYLEAQMMGLPVAALNSMGVPLTVHHGQTGLLAAETNMDQYTENLMTLLSHPELRRDLGDQARKSVETGHSIQSGSRALSQALSTLLAPTG